MFFLTTEFTEERMRDINIIFMKNKIFCKLIFTKLCVLCGLLSLCILMLSGCASTGDIEALNKNVGVQRVELDQLKASVDSMSRDVTLVKEQGVGALKESQASLLSQVSDLSKAIQVLEGRFDENKYNVDRTIKDLLAEKDLQQARLASLENEIKALKT